MAIEKLLIVDVHYVHCVLKNVTFYTFYIENIFNQIKVQ